jgi:hypothetical protein
MAKHSQNLATSISSRFEDFLVELLNLHPEGVVRFVERFADFGLFDPRIIQSLSHAQYALRERKLVAVIGPRERIVPRSNANTPLYLNDEDEFKSVEKVKTDEEEIVRQIVVPYFLDIFQATWLEPDAKTRQWGWALLRTELARPWFIESDYLSLRMDDSERFRLPQPPEELPIEKAFDYLLKHHHRTRYCPNPECVAPYFFAKRHTQRYCSEKCAQVCERESKRRWWAEHGQGWRTARASRKSSEKGRSKGQLSKGAKQTVKRRGK